MLSYFPRGVLDEILNLIESVSEDFPPYSSVHGSITATLHHVRYRQIVYNGVLAASRVTFIFQSRKEQHEPQMRLISPLP